MIILDLGTVLDVANRSCNVCDSRIAVQNLWLSLPPEP